MMIEQIQIHFPRYATSVICNILQRDAECAARWQVEKHLPRLPCSDGLPDGGCVDGAAILVAPSTLPIARGACGGTLRGRWFSGWGMQRIGNLVHADFRFAMPLSALCTSALPHTLSLANLQPHHAPHLFAEGPAVWLAIWRIWAAFANSQMLKQTQILRPICTDCLRHLRHLLQRGWRNGCCRAGCWLC